MKEQYITFETAKLAYQKGFNLPDKGYYIPMYCIDGEMMKEKLGYQNELPENFEKGFIIAPSQSLLQKWLRDSHRIYVESQMYLEDGLYKFKFLVKSDFEYDLIILSQEKNFPLYEEALETGLQEALNLINKENG